MKPVNEYLHNVTLEDIYQHKDITQNELLRDVYSLKEFNPSHNNNSFYGNPFLYNFQLKNLLNCKRDGGRTISEVYSDQPAWDKLVADTMKRDRGGRTAAGNVFECFRINLGSVVMFKSTTAKYLYKKFNAKNVLDPTAGWGGRMLGAWSLDINYTGIDTNIEMKSAYDEMIEFLGENNPPSLFDDDSSNLSMIWDSCLDVDFSKIKYDFVLTSPPYINLEVYEHMETWESDKAFYTDFFIPLWDKCADNIEKGGHICFNISPKMYDAALDHGLTPCDDEEDLKQQLGQQTDKKRQDKVYIWNC